MADNTATRQALIQIGFMLDAVQAIVDEKGIDSLNRSHF
jgi:hypothetical protein